MDDLLQYRTPRGFDDLIMASDGAALTDLCFAGSHNAPAIRRDDGGLPNKIALLAHERRFSIMV